MIQSWPLFFNPVDLGCQICLSIDLCAMVVESPQLSVLAVTVRIGDLGSLWYMGSQ